MEPDQISFAKITKPRLRKALPRRRLFGLLDGKRTWPGTWVCGPGGSGKTTLIASYIEENNLPCLWYQIDESDSDIATFFYFLGLAGKKLASGKKDLPLLTPEYALGISTFTRRFFENLFDRLEKPGVLVLDNYQDIPRDCRLHEVLRDALTVTPEDINVFIVSRTEPPRVLARSMANDLLHEIGWPVLRLQPQETKDLVRLLSEGTLSESVISSLHKKTDGWIAGIILLLKRAATESIDAEAFTQFTAHEVSDYFTSEIFDKADKETQEFLLSTSVLPTFSATMAQKLTGSDNAEQILDRIRQNHWFTERFPGRETRYQYHPLFREYLQSRAAQAFTSEQMTRLKEAAARLLESDGQIEPAIELFLESVHPHEVVRLILSQAEMLVIQGRNQTLEQWLRRLPEDVFSEYPYAVYWLGVSRHHFNQDEGRELFEKAFSLFEEQEDTEGICLSLCGILDSITFAWDSFKPLDQWIPKLTQLSMQYEALPSPKVQGKLAAVALFVLAFREPNHPEFKTWEKRSRAVLQENIPGETKLRAIAAWTWQRLFLGNLAEAGHFIEMHREKVQSSDIPPIVLFALKNMEAYYHFLSSNAEKCSKMVADALNLASATGIHFTSPIVMGHGAAGALSAQDLDSADKHLGNMARYAHSSDWIFIYFKILKIWKALLEKDFSRALLEGESAKAYVAESGMPMTDAVWHQGMAIAWHASGNQDEALRYLEKALSISRWVGFSQIAFGCYLTKAEFALDAGDETAARNWLQQAMAIGKAQQYVNTWLWRSDAMARLCCKALEENIEVAYVQDLILQRNLIPQSPPLEIENWPWPIKIYTLGRCEVIKDGTPLSFPKKVQGKPLALLKSIIGLGGRSVSEAKIIDMLWPDADGDAAAGAFKTTLHRLRKLLGYHEAFVRDSGNITLDNRYCWVDAWIFERRLSEADAILQSAANGKELQKAAELTEKALEYYKGPLFQSDDDMAISQRHYLHHRFSQALQWLAEYCQERKEWEKAIALYETGLKIDGLAEPFYRGLMICNHRIGQKAKALAAYNRCKKALAEKLNTPPSAETKALKNSLLNQ